MKGNRFCRWCGGVVSSWNHHQHRNCKPNERVLVDAGFEPATWHMHTDDRAASESFRGP